MSGLRRKLLFNRSLDEHFKEVLLLEKRYVLLLVNGVACGAALLAVLEVAKDATATN